LGWNVVGIVVLALTAWSARSVALAGFGLDSLIEIGASTVVVWELSGSTDEARQRRALRLIGVAFTGLAAYLLVQSTVVLAIGHHPRHSPLGIAWTAVTAAVMFDLAAGKARTGQALDNPVLSTEGRVTLIDGLLAVAVLLGLALTPGSVGGGRTRSPATFWSSTPRVRCGKSSSAGTDRPSVPPEKPGQTDAMVPTEGRTGERTPLPSAPGRPYGSHPADTFATVDYRAPETHWDTCRCVRWTRGRSLGALERSALPAHR
jgi:hypothetical protein